MRSDRTILTTTNGQEISSIILLTMKIFTTAGVVILVALEVGCQLLEMESARQPPWARVYDDSVYTAIYLMRQEALFLWLDQGTLDGFWYVICDGCYSGFLASHIASHFVCIQSARLSDDAWCIRAWKKSPTAAEKMTLDVRNLSNMDENTVSCLSFLGTPSLRLGAQIWWLRNGKK